MSQHTEYLDPVALTAWLAHSGYALFEDLDRGGSPAAVTDAFIARACELAEADEYGRVPVSVLRADLERV